MKVLCFRFYGVMLVVVGIVCGVGLGPIRAVEGGRETSEPILCLEYLGDSDKPVFPILLADFQPTKDDRKLLLARETEAEFATVVVLPASDMKRLATEFREWNKTNIGTKPVDPVLRVSLASFERATNPSGSPMVIMGERHVLNHRAAVKWLHRLTDFEPSNRASTAELREALRIFRVRTQLNPTPQKP